MKETGLCAEMFECSAVLGLRLFGLRWLGCLDEFLHCRLCADSHLVKHYCLVNAELMKATIPWQLSVLKTALTNNSSRPVPFYTGLKYWAHASKGGDWCGWICTIIEDIQVFYYSFLNIQPQNFSLGFTIHWDLIKVKCAYGFWFPHCPPILAGNGINYSMLCSMKYSKLSQYSSDVNVWR